VPSQPRQVQQSLVLHGSWSWRIYGWLCSQQHWRVLPSSFHSLARRGSHAIFLLSELCYALNVCRRRAQKLSVLACFPF
jgi:hypothetical protein